METLLRRLPVWLMAIIAISAIVLLAFGFVSGHQVSLWPPSIGPLNSAVRCPSMADLAHGNLKHWRFGRSNGEQISPDFVLSPGGKVTGYTASDNERKWEVVGNELRLYGASGATTTTFSTINCYRVVELVGDANSGGFNHILTRPLSE